MSFHWQKTEVEQFAKFERILEQGIFAIDGIFWKRVRPLFYRPLLPFQEYQSGSVRPPSLGSLGGFQYAVPRGEKANSFLNLLMFENADTYSLDQLDYNRRRQVRQAAKQFTIRPITDKEEFKREAYPVYLSFYERTRYPHGSRRRDAAFFAQWTDALFQIPQAAILGGYYRDALGGVSVTLLLENTVSYAMFFCNDKSLRLGLSDLMLHTVRDTTATERCATKIFAGLYKGGKGLDDFYLLRGCRLVRKPAFLRLNPLAELVLKRFAPREYRRLRGGIQNSSASRGVRPDLTPQVSPAQSSSQETLSPKQADAIKDPGPFHHFPSAQRQ